VGCPELSQPKRLLFRRIPAACSLHTLAQVAFADAFDLGRVQRIDLPSALMLALLAHAAGEHQRMGEDALQFGVVLDLARDVARDPAEIGSDRLQRPVGALELLGVGVALMGDQRMFAHPRVGLAVDFH
jgi:hypothetical protein